jgi:hypothetical protein
MTCRVCGRKAGCPGDESLKGICPESGAMSLQAAWNRMQRGLATDASYSSGCHECHMVGQHKLQCSQRSDRQPRLYARLATSDASHDSDECILNCKRPAVFCADHVNEMVAAAERGDALPATYEAHGINVAAPDKAKVPLDLRLLAQEWCNDNARCTSSRVERESLLALLVRVSERRSEAAQAGPMPPCKRCGKPQDTGWCQCEPRTADAPVTHPFTVAMTAMAIRDADAYELVLRRIAHGVPDPVGEAKAALAAADERQAESRRESPTQVMASVAGLLATLKVARHNGWHAKDLVAIAEAEEQVQKRMGKAQIRDNTGDSDDRSGVDEVREVAGVRAVRVGSRAGDQERAELPPQRTEGGELGVMPGPSKAPPDAVTLIRRDIAYWSDPGRLTRKESAFVLGTLRSLLRDLGAPDPLVAQPAAKAGLPNASVVPPEETVLSPGEVAYGESAARRPDPMVGCHNCAEPKYCPHPCARLRTAEAKLGVCEHEEHERVEIMGAPPSWWCKECGTVCFAGLVCGPERLITERGVSK